MILFIITPSVILLQYNSPKNNFLSYFYLIPFLTLISGINATIGAWASRLGLFKKIALNRVIQNISSVTIQICIGFYIGGVSGLAISYCIGLLLSFLHLNQQIKTIVPVISSSIKLKEIFNTIKKYKQLFIFALPSDFINNFSNQLPVLMLTAYSSPSSVGYYNMSNRLISLPISFLTSSISEVFRQRASQQYLETGNCKALVIKTVTTLFFISIVPFLVCMIFAPILFNYVLGKQWEQAGVFAQLIGILFFFKLVISPVSYIVFLAKKFLISLVMDIIVVVSSLLTLFIGLKYFKSIEIALFSYALNYALLYFLTLYLSIKYAEKAN